MNYVVIPVSNDVADNLVAEVLDISFMNSLFFIDVSFLVVIEALFAFVPVNDVFFTVLSSLTL